MFIMLIREYSKILAPNSENDRSLFFSDDLVTFFHFTVSRVDLELGLGAEFPHVAVATGNLTSVFRQQPLLSCHPGKCRTPLREVKASNYGLLLFADRIA